MNIVIENRDVHRAGFELARLVTFAAARVRVPVDQVRVVLHPLRGGLEATALAKVDVRVLKGTDRVLKDRFVVKRLDGWQQREAALYRSVLGRSAAPAPRLLGSECVAPEVTYLYLEHVRAVTAWPWRDTRFAGLVLEQLVAVHQMPTAPLAHILHAWDYEAHLMQSADATLELLERAMARGDSEWPRWTRGALRRTVLALPAIRRTLLHATPLGVAVLHGDVHSSNTVLRRKHNRQEIVLLDWARARFGSPLEDVASWLQSLGHWEPEARRRHDTLMGRYLLARDLGSLADRPMRDAYWLAAASNALAGALRYHLSVICARPDPSKRRAALRAAHDQLRVIRRADAVWRR
jgi:hypothetical protein